MEGAEGGAGLQDKLGAFKNILGSQIEHPPGNDARIGAYAIALESGLNNPGPLQDFFSELLQIKPDISSSHLATKTLRAAQSQLYTAFPNEYPRDFISPDKWRQGFDWIFEDYERAAQFTVDVWARPLQSNVSDRYKGIKALAVLAQQFGRLETFDVLDVGCSQNAGLNHLASGIGFNLPTLVRPGSPNLEPNLQHTAAFHNILNTPIELAPSVGVDAYSPEDSRAWAWSCSHYPSELLDEQRVALFNALINAQYDNVNFFKGNFADFDTAAFQQVYPDKKFGIVNFSTVLYQSDAQDVQSMLRQAERYARDFIVVQDFIKIDPERPSQLIFRDNWQDEPFPYRMVVRDMQDDSRIWHELFRWQDGRCNQLAIGLGRIALWCGRSSSLWGAIDLMAKRL